MVAITVGSLGSALLVDGRPFDRPTAARAGLSTYDVTALLGAGALRQPVRGVYIDARVPDDLTTRAACVALRLPADAVVGRLTAAWLWGVDGRMPEQRAAPPLVECVVPVRRQPVRRPGVRCYVAPLGDDVCEVDGVPVTTPLRTALDALRWLSPHMGLAVTDALAAASLVTRESLLVRIADMPGVRGIAKARYLADLVEPRTESMGESWLRLRIVDAGFPRPVVQVEILDADMRCVYRLDLGWPDRRLAVEYDGEEFHSNPAQLARDRRRRAELDQRFGWYAIGVGKGEVLGRSLALERGLGELLGLEPRIVRRTW
jgi:AbiEi antitoxin C-terminal domain